METDLMTNAKKSYLYKLIPDFSIIDYAEYLYWSKHSEYSSDDTGDAWYDILKVDNSETNIKTTNYYRMLIASDYILEFNKENTKLLVYDLSTYQNRYIYAVFSDDENPQKITIKVDGSDLNFVEDKKNNGSEDFYGYATLIRF